MSNKGGRPARIIGERAVIVSLSITAKEKEKFEAMASLLEINKSELFRRMSKIFYTLGDKNNGSL